MSQRYQRSWDDQAIKGVDLSLREVDGLWASVDDVRADIREVTEDARREAVARWEMSHRPGSKRTGNYRNAIRAIFFDDGWTGKVFVSTQADTRFGNGVRPVNLPLWLEYGTRFMRAMPHLGPAFELGRRKLNRLIEARLARMGAQG